MSSQGCGCAEGGIFALGALAWILVFGLPFDALKTSHLAVQAAVAVAIVFVFTLAGKLAGIALYRARHRDGRKARRSIAKEA